VAPYLLLVLVLLEVLQWLPARADAARRLGRLAACGAAAGASFLALLALLDRIAAPYSPQTGKLVPNGPLGQVAHILSYAAHQTSPHGPRGIASYPWDWLVDYKPITYLTINPGRPSAALNQVQPAVHFLGMISPPILLLALPSLLFAASGAARSRLRSRDDVGIIGLAWFLGTFLPFVALSLIESRTSYLYYMVIVMPGIYVGAANLAGRILVGRNGLGRGLVVAWMACVLAAAIVMYPFTPLP
jgi:hypothetical protein